jgi:hypothetical protein
VSVTLTYEGGSKSFETYFVKGFDNPDELEFRLGINEELFDGTLVQRIMGVRRIFTLGLQISTPRADRVWLSGFCLGTTKSVTYFSTISETVPVILFSPEYLTTEWLDDVEMLRYCELKLRADEIITSQVPGGPIIPPDIWSTWEQWYDADGNPMYDSDNNPIYVRV